MFTTARLFSRRLLRVGRARAWKGVAVDAVTVVVTLAAAALALLPRIPALSAQGRKQARLRDDVEVWKSMPEGDTRDALKEAIEAETREMLAERGRDRNVQTALLASGLLALLGTLTLAAADPANRARWQATARTMFAEAGLIALVFSVAAMSLAIGLMAAGPVAATWNWLRRCGSWMRARLITWVGSA